MQLFIVILVMLSFGISVLHWKKEDKQSSITFFIAGVFLIFCFVSLRVLSH